MPARRPAVVGLTALSLAHGLYAADRTPPKLVSNGLAGYISMAVPAPPDDYRYGVSLYAAAWPLVERPIRDFQIGLASIWIVPDNRSINYPLLPTGTVARDHWPERGPSYRDVFQTIEGGLGFWASTRFGSTTAKFRMNGTANGYNHEISSPGWPFGGVKALTAEQMGIAQLSPRLLTPPDGLTFRDGACGELFGYAWMALPLTQPKDTTAGQPVTTGNQCWTLFLNATNFRGPVAFYTPVTWSRISRRHPPAIGRGLDARPGLVTGGAIEINTVPRFVAQDAAGSAWTKVPRLQFPVDAEGRTVLIHNLTHYSKAALWDQVQAWLAGGAAPTVRFEADAGVVPPCRANPLVVRQGEDRAVIRGLDQWLKTTVFDHSTFGLQWTGAGLEPWTNGLRRGCLPEYCKADGRQMEAVTAAEVPAETGLKEAQFQPAVGHQAYTSPDGGDNCWHKPGPAAGPFRVTLGDGSVVTYYWYKFINQPSLQDADLSDAEKARLQGVAEQIHRQWTPERDYLPPPTAGALATLDAALLVTPPAGLEVGYVPIVTRQAAE
jgi:hypothetical protein